MQKAKDSRRPKTKGQGWPRNFYKSYEKKVETKIRQLNYPAIRNRDNNIFKVIENDQHNFQVRKNLKECTNFSAIKVTLIPVHCTNKDDIIKWKLFSKKNLKFLPGANFSIFGLS